jgi:hypothetical protein
MKHQVMKPFEALGKQRTPGEIIEPDDAWLHLQLLVEQGYLKLLPSPLPEPVHDKSRNEPARTKTAVSQ